MTYLPVHRFFLLVDQSYCWALLVNISIKLYSANLKFLFGSFLWFYLFVYESEFCIFRITKTHLLIFWKIILFIFTLVFCQNWPCCCSYGFLILLSHPSCISREPLKLGITKDFTFLAWWWIYCYHRAKNSLPYHTFSFKSLITSGFYLF